MHNKFHRVRACWKGCICGPPLNSDWSANVNFSLHDKYDVKNQQMFFFSSGCRCWTCLWQQVKSSISSQSDLWMLLLLCVWNRVCLTHATTWRTVSTLWASFILLRVFRSLSSLYCVTQVNLKIHSESL